MTVDEIARCRRKVQDKYRRRVAVTYAKAVFNGSGTELDGNRLADKAVVGTDWWIVMAGLRGNIITDQDIHAAGITIKELERTVVTHD